jgi:hypothetical protein
MGLKDITDKALWIEAKAVIDFHLCRTPFWPSPTSKTLITMPENMVASAWWEELVYYYLKPPVHDLFVEETCFDGNGFEMLDYTDKHFNPSGAVGLLGYIFDLIDIMHGADKPIVTLQAHFSCIFASLKMRGVDIGSALQAGFMLRSLLSRYSTVVTDYQLGCHSLTSATLQSVVEHCTAFDKNPWTGPVGHNGCPVCSPLVNTAGASQGEPSATYNTMEYIPFNYHLSRWHKSPSDLANKCLICHNSARSNKHTAAKCPIVKNLGMKLKKCSATNNSNKSSARVASNAPTASTPAPAPSPLLDGGSTTIPGACTASIEVDTYESGNDFFTHLSHTHVPTHPWRLSTSPPSLASPFLL